MKKLFLTAMTFFAVMTGYAQTFAGGDGTEANPYLIATAEHMKSINTAATAGETTYFKMTADVDMSSVKDWVPFNQADPYDKRVMFDGDGHTIKNFSYSSNGGYPSFAGVLYGEIKNVCFVNASVTNEAGSHTGIVAGYLGTTGKAGVIENVMVTGTLTNNNPSIFSGGVAGNFRLGTLRNCYVDVTINTKSNEDVGQGGIVGYQYDGHNTHDMAHPICTTLENSYFCGSIETNGGVIGGIVGKGEDRTGSITQNNINNSRSLRGYLRAAQAHKTGYIMGSCPDALVKVKQLVKNNYSAPGYIYDKDTKTEAVLNPDVDGQQGGSNFGTITSENLCSVASTLGWDTNVWDLTGDTPVLKISIRANGSKSNPYLIATADDMKAIADKVAAGETVYFKMTADVDMAGVENWVPFNAADPYNKRVVFDGDGHTISNFSSGNTSYSSFAGVVNGEIKNVAFVNANIQSTYNNCGVIGGFIGTRGGVSGVVENVMIQGSVTNASNLNAKVGGVCGDFASGVIRNCYVDVNVTSATSNDNGVGGIAGYQYDGKNLDKKTDVKNTIIENCYFVGSVNASAAQVGGILGKSENRYGNWVKGNINNAVSLNGAASCGNSTQTVGLIMGRCYADYYAKGCVLNNYSGQNTKAFTNGTAIERTEGQQNDSYNGTIATDNLCATAKTIGWDENVWNLDGSVPMLKAFPYTSTDLTLEATDGEAYYATFSAAEPVFFPNDVEVLAVTVDGNTLNMDKAFGGNYVPANTGVLLKTAGTAVTYYTDKKTIAPSAAENALIAGTGTTPDDASKKYYKLAYCDSSKTPTTLGFYWGEENGAPFQTTVGKAYLVVGASAAKASYRFFEDETTGITTMTPQPTTHNQMYNLAGQRVNVNAKGIVIKNGKKFINK